MKIRVNNKCIPINKLVSIEEYAQLNNCTRANVYYHVRNNNVNHVKIANTTFIVNEKLLYDNQQDS